MADLDLQFRGSLDSLMKSPNIAVGMAQGDRDKIGLWCKQGYEEDKGSRAQWEQNMATAIKLALQIKEAKTYPWPDCSNIKFPLITVAALGFHARAYPNLIPPSGVVKCGPVGYQPPQELEDRCARVGAHMSYQIQRCTSWEAETDKALLVLAIMGCAFKKVYYDPASRRRHADLVLPQNLVVHYQTTDLDHAPRFGEYFQYTRNDIVEEERGGYWLTPPAVPGQQAQPPATGLTQQDVLTAAKAEAQGVSPVLTTSTGLFDFVEEYVWLDLDGDGYEEPYVCTFDLTNGFLRRIVARYTPSGVRKEGSKVLRIEAERTFVKLPFIPSPDGGFYDMGLGMLLGPINASVDTAINQLFDAATMSTLGGGFLGRGARIKRGTTAFEPGEWKQVDSAGQDLSANVVPLPIRDPSRAMFDLLVYLVGYAERIASANEVQQGEVPDFNMKAEVMRTADANGSRIFAAIYKRLWRAFGEEFKLFYRLNRNFPLELDYEQNGQWFQISQEDYMGGRYEVLPAADPNVVTDGQRRENADLVLKMAMSIPGHDLAACVKNVYQSRNIPDIDKLFPVTEVPQAPNIDLMKVQIAGQVAQYKGMEVMIKVQEARIRLQMEAEKNSAEILNLYAQAAEHAANADAEATYADVAKLNATIGALKMKNEGILGMLDILTKLATTQKENSNGTDTGTGGGSSPGGGGASPALSGMVGGAGGQAFPALPPSPASGNAD